FGAGGTAAGVRDGACFEYVRLSGGGETGEHAMTVELLASVSNCFLSKLTAIQDGARLRLQVEYDASVSSETEALRLGEAFTNLLESALKNPGWRSERLEILSSEARRKILAFSRGPEAQIETPFVHEAFEQQARRRPDAVAVVSEDRSLSYDELNRRTNQLGQYLRRLGV